MLILELAVQGVRGFSPAARVALGPGYVWLRSPTEFPAPVSGLLLALGFPDGRGGDGAFLAPGATSGRAGFSVQADDGTIWRVVRDLGGAGALHRLSAVTQQFEVVTSAADEFEHHLREGVGFPPRALFEALLTFSPGQLPSKRARLAKTLAGVRSDRGAGARPTALTGLDAEAARARIGVLETELVRGKQVAEIQYQADGVQSEIFKNEQLWKAHQEKRAQLEAARAERDAAPTARALGLPEDIVDRVARSGESKKRFDEAMRKLLDERDCALQRGGIVVESIVRDRSFWAAIAAGLLFLGGAAFLQGSLRYLALLSIPAFSFAAILMLRFIEDLQAASREAAKVEVFDAREKKLRDDHQLSQTVVMAAMEKVGAATSEEFAAAFSKREAGSPLIAALEREVASLEATSEFAACQETLSHLRREFERLTADLAHGSGGYARDVREIEQDLELLREQVEPSRRPNENDRISGGTDSAEPFEDPIPAIMRAGAEVFGTDVPSLWGAMRDRSLQYLMALTDRRYQGVDVDAGGHAYVQVPGRDLPVSSLSGRDLDLVFLSLRLTLVEKWCATQKVPVILDEGATQALDAAQRPLFGRMLKHLGTLTQVLHVTGMGQSASEADLTCSL
jgi:hypothetical protein